MLTEDELAEALHNRTDDENLPVDDIVARSVKRGRNIRRRRNALRITAVSCVAAMVVVGAGAVVNNRYGSNQYPSNPFAGPMIPAGPSSTSEARRSTTGEYKSTLGHYDPRAITLRVIKLTLAQAPLPHGTRPATAQEADGKSAQMLAADPNQLDRHATYVVPLAYQQAINWFKGHTPPGLKPSGTSTATGSDGPTIEGIYFAGPNTITYDALMEQVAVYRLDSTQVVVRIDGSAIWLPARTAAESAPFDATAVDVIRTTRLGAAPQHFTLTGSAVRRLAQTLNDQLTLSNGSRSCPADVGASDVLHFTGSTPDPIYRVQASGCASITVTNNGVDQPTLDGARAVDRVLVGLLPHHK